MTHVSLRAAIPIATLLTLTAVPPTSRAGSAGSPIFVKPAANGGSDAHNGLSWNSAKATIQAGVSSAVSGGEVWVAAGVYPGSVTIPSGTAIELLGGFAGHESDKAERDPATYVTTIDGENTENTVLIGEPMVTVDGFHIINGSNGGVFTNEQNVILRNNTVSGCAVGIWAGFTTLIENCDISGNAHEGVIAPFQCEIRACTISRNGAAGVVAGSETRVLCCDISENNDGIFVNYDTFGSLIEGNLIHDNHGNGVTGQGPATVSRNTARNNAGTGIQMMQGGTWTSVLGNLVCGNHAGVWLDDIARVRNNTIVGNMGPGLEVQDAMDDGDVVNNIIAWNGAGVLLRFPGVPLVALNNDVVLNSAFNWDGMPNPTGTGGNIAADPLFVDRDAGNLRLSDASPCIDAGDDSAVSVCRDLDGRPRPNGAHVDMGAYELPKVAVVYCVDHDAPGPAHDGKTWATAFLTVPEAMDIAFAGDEVWVATAYPEDYDLPVTIRSGVGVYGGFEGTEVTRDQRILTGPATCPLSRDVQVVCQVGDPSVRGTIDGFCLRWTTVTLNQGTLFSIRSCYLIQGRILGGASVEITDNLMSETMVHLVGMDNDTVEYVVCLLYTSRCV